MAVFGEPPTTALADVILEDEGGFFTFHIQ